MLKVAVVGVGYWGPNHVRVFSNLSDAQVTHVCDLDEQKLKKISAHYPNITTTKSLDDITSNPDIDAVILCVPPINHFETAKKILEAGKHILVEKPITLTSKHAQKLIDIAAKKKLVLMAGHTFLYNNAVYKVKEYIDSGEIGDVLNIFTQRSNLGQLRKDLDVLWNLAPHDISIITYWLDGELPKQISARGFCYVKSNKKLADVGYITLEYKNGVVGQIHCSWLSPEKVRKIIIVGSKKMIVFDDVTPDSKVQLFDKGLEDWHAFEDFGEFQLKTRSGDLIIPKIENHEPLHTQALHFIDCIENKTPCLTDGKAGLEVVKILEKASESANKQGKCIKYGKL